MWYIHPTEKWIEEVVRLMNEKQLKPENSKFMIAFFSSMDNDFVTYFKENKEKITSFSGRNFHIFTPLIFEGNTISDDEWRYLRKEFVELGVPVKSDPTFIFFSLDDYSRANSHGYYPNFFAGFVCKSFNNFPNKLKNAIDTCIEIKNIHPLSEKLSEIFLSENIIRHNEITPEFRDLIARKLPKSTIFISHSSLDKPFVRKLADELSNNSSINVWIDEKEILASDDIQQTITNALQFKSDFLILVISENSTKSDWVKFEVSQFMGFANGRNIIPILISKESSFPKPIDNLIARLKYLDFTDETKWQANIQELNQVILNKGRMENNSWR